MTQNKSPLVGSSGHTSRSEVPGSMKGDDFFNYPNHCHIV